MNRFYSKDTDTLAFVFSNEHAVDIIDLDYQTLLELDANRFPVMLTIEHAVERGVRTDAREPPLVEDGANFP